MSGIEVKGAQTLFYIGSIAITETILSLIVVSAILMIGGFLAGRNLQKRPGAMQVLTEKGVDMLINLVTSTMGEHNIGWAPLMGTIFLCSICGSFIGLTGFFRSATADLSCVLVWAIMVSVIIWSNNIKHKGFLGWLKGFTEPIVVMTPMNIVSEIAQPLSMAFRHFGNVAGGSVLTMLIYAALAVASKLLFGWLPAVVAEMLPPVLQAGIPAFLSLYFDFFSGFVQAFVFCLLTMVYVAGACPPPEEIAEEKE